MSVKRTLCLILVILSAAFSACSREHGNIADSTAENTVFETAQTMEIVQQETEQTEAIPDVTESDSIPVPEETTVEPPMTEPQTETDVLPPAVQTDPVQTEPVQPKPVQTEPVQPKPVQTEPVQTKPVQTEPVQTKPVQTEPVQTEPVQTEPPAVNMEAIIDANLDLLISGSGEHVREEDIIAQNPEAFEAILALGQDAIPYLWQCGSLPTENAAQAEINRAALALYAAYKIRPNADIVSASPDGTKQVRLDVVSFIDIFTMHRGPQYRASVIDTESGECTVTALTQLYCPELHWSPDGRYVGISYGREARDTATIILDTVAGRELVPPHGDMSRQVFGSVDPSRGGERFYTFTAVPESWYEHFIRVSFTGIVAPEWIEGQPGGAVGYYTFDLRTLSVTDCILLPYYNLTTLPPPDNDTEQAIHDRLLLLAGDGDCRIAAELISRNRQAFAEILAMGDAALIYLKEVYYTDYGPDDPAHGYLYSAKIIADTAITHISGQGGAMIRFAMTEDYDTARETAYAFFSAYREGDLSAAQSLMDSPDNACLTAFPTAPTELHLQEGYAFYPILCDTAEDGDVIGIRAELRYTNEAEPEGLFGLGCWIIQLKLARITSTDDAGNPYDAWCVSSFELA